MRQLSKWWTVISFSPDFALLKKAYANGINGLINMIMGITPEA